MKESSITSVALQKSYFIKFNESTGTRISPSFRLKLITDSCHVYHSTTQPLRNTFLLFEIVDYATFNFELNLRIL